MATRETILDEAYDCVREVGIRRTTIGEVARRAGVSRMTVHTYFGDKASLIDAVLLRNGHLIRERLDERLAKLGTFEAKVVAAAELGARAGESFLGLHDTEPETLALMLTTGAEPWIARATDFWMPHVRDAKRAGEIRAELAVRPTARWVARSLFNLAITPCTRAERRRTASIYIAGGLR